MNIARVTKTFFDRRAVIEAVGRANAMVLSKAGAFIRRSAKGSIRYSKNPSKPGRPPHAHRSKTGGKSSPFGNPVELLANVPWGWATGRGSNPLAGNAVTSGSISNSSTAGTAGFKLTGLQYAE